MYVFSSYDNDEYSILHCIRLIYLFLAYYWRVQKDFAPVPEPIVLIFNENIKLHTVRDAILELGENASRVVIHFKKRNFRRNPLLENDHNNKNNNKNDNSQSFRKQNFLDLSFSSSTYYESNKDIRKRVIIWAKDSVGKWERNYSQELLRYGIIPSIRVNYTKINSNYIGARDIVRATRTCVEIFYPMRGNRSCFDKCD